MYLGKSCSSQFHVSNSGTLRIGTLYEYRHIESPQIVDSDEGVFNTELSINGPIAIDRKWFNTISAGVILYGEDETPRYGGFNASIDVLDIAGNFGDKVLLNAYHAKIKREASNGFIFCMSQCQSKTDIENIFPDYDSYWFIRQEDSFQFGVAIATELKKCIIESHAAGNYIVDASIDINDFNIYLKAEPVFYIDRDILIDAHSDFSVESILDRMKNMNYIKPRSFVKEREFRFHFLVASKGREYPPLVRNLIIDASGIVRFLV